MKNGPQHRKAYDYNLFPGQMAWLCVGVCNFVRIREKTCVQRRLRVGLRLKGGNITVTNLLVRLLGSISMCLKGWITDVLLGRSWGGKLKSKFLRLCHFLQLSLCLKKKKSHCMIMFWRHSCVYGWPDCTVKYRSLVPEFLWPRALDRRDTLFRPNSGCRGSPELFLRLLFHLSDYGLKQKTHTNTRRV